MRHLWNSFSSGKWSERLRGRIDVDKYTSACQEAQNMFLTKYGSARNRTGTEHIAEVKNSAQEVRLIPFQFNTDQTYIIEMGDQYMRFYKNGARLGAPYEISTPYLEADLFDLHYAQINDIIYIVGANYTPRKLARTSDTSWTLTEVDFNEFMPMLDDDDTDTTIAPSGTSGSVTLTASTGIFTSDNVGSVYKLTQTQPAQSVKIDFSANVTSSALTVEGDWFFRTYGSWTADIEVQESQDGGTTWVAVAKYSSSNNRNVDLAGNSDGVYQIRMVISNRSVGSGTDFAVLEHQSYEYNVYYDVTAYTSATQVTATTLTTNITTSATKTWAEGAYSTRRGFPSAITFHEQRLILGGTTFEPAKIWFSGINDFENFQYGTTDTDSFRYTIATTERNSIEWLSSSQDLLVGTTGGEFRVSSSDFNSTITATDIGIKRQSNFGSANIQALVSNYTTIYAQRNGTKIREMALTEDGYTYRSDDLTVLSEDITGTGIKQMALRQQEDTIIFAVTNENQLIGLTYEKSQNVFGWHQHVTEGTIESVASIYGTNGEDDEVWIVANRTNGKYVERLAQLTTTAEDQWYLDSAIEQTGAPFTVITGLTHLEGQTVGVLADGAVRPSATVSSGQITLASEASKAIVGLPYRSILSPMPLAVGDNFGTPIGARKRISTLIIKLLNTVGLKYGSSTSSLDTLSFRDSSMAMDEPVPFFTGEKRVNFMEETSTESNVFIVQDDPLPLEVLAIACKYEIKDM